MYPMLLFFSTFQRPLSKQWRFLNSKVLSKVCGHPIYDTKPKIDWDAVGKIGNKSFYRTWDSGQIIPGPLSKCFVERKFDQWHRSRKLLGLVCFENQTPIIHQELSFQEFSSACIYLLMGISSNVFNYDIETNKFEIANSVFLTGVSQESLASFSKKMMAWGESFRNLTNQLDLWSTTNSHDSQSLFGNQWYAIAVQQLLNEYLGRIVTLPTASTLECSSNSFLLFSRFLDAVLCETVNIEKLDKITNEIEALRLSLDMEEKKPWLLFTHHHRLAILASWDESEFLEQHLLASTLNPFLESMCNSAYFGFSQRFCPWFENFGLLVNKEALRYRDQEFWLKGFQVDYSQVDGDFKELFECIIAIGRCVELLKICDPDHFLLTLFRGNSMVPLTFVPADCDGNSYFNHLKLIETEFSMLRESSVRYFDELKMMAVRTVQEKIIAINKELKERDELLAKIKEEKMRKNIRKKQQLRNEQLAETASKRKQLADDREREQKEDEEIVRRLALQENMLRTELQQRLVEEEKRKLVEYYAEMERQAEWRRSKAEWRLKRLQLHAKRLRHFNEMSKSLSQLEFYDVPLVVLKAPFIPREIPDSDVRVPFLERVEVNKEETKPNIDPEPYRNSTVEKEVSSGPVVLTNQIASSIEQPSSTPDVPEVSLVQKEPELEETEIAADESISDDVESQIEIPITDYIVDTDEKMLSTFKVNENINNWPSFKDPLDAFGNALFSKKPLYTKTRLTSIEDHLVFTELFEKCLIEPARLISSFANTSVVEYFRQRLDLVGHLTALRHFMLMDAGEFAIAMSIPIFQKVCATEFDDRPNLSFDTLTGCKISNVFLERTLENAVQYVSSPISVLLAEERSRADNKIQSVFSLQQDFTARLNVSLIEQDIDPSKPFCFDVIKLSYLVGWPLNIIFPDNDLATYTQVFSFLLEMCRIVYLLDSCRQLLDDCSKVAKKQSSLVDVSTTFAALRCAHHARCLMRFFFSSLQNYLSSHVLRPLWNSLIEKIAKAKTLDDLRNCHFDYLEDLRKR